MDNISLFLMDLIFNCVTMIALIHFYGKVFIVKKNLARTVYYVGLFFSLCLSIFEVWDSTFYFAPYILILSIPLLWFYHKNPQKKVFMLVSLAANFLSILFIYDIITSSIKHSRKATTIYFMIFLITLLSIFIANISSSNKQDAIPTFLWLPLILIPVSSIVASGSAFFVLFNRNQTTSILVILFAFFFPNLIIFAIYNQILLYRNSIREQELLQQEISLQQEHYQVLADTHEKILALKHDFKNSVATALLMTTNNENDILEEYLKTVSGVISDSETIIASGNPNMDSILNYKISQLESEGVHVTTQIHIPTGLNVSFKTITVVLGNLLDNCREACQALDENDRWVNIAINYVNNVLLIIIKNPYRDSFHNINDQGLPNSTKNDSTNHGFGLKSVATVVDESGTLNIEYSDNIFIAKVALYDLCQV